MSLRFWSTPMLNVSSCLIRAIITHTPIIQTPPACFTAEEQAAVESALSTAAVARQYDALIRRHGPYPFFLVQLGIHHRFMNTQATSGNVAAFPPIYIGHVISITRLKQSWPNWVSMISSSTLGSKRAKQNLIKTFGLHWKNPRQVITVFRVVVSKHGLHNP